MPTALSSVCGLALSPRLIHLRTSGCWSPSCFCLLRLSSTCFHRLAILLATTFLGGVRLSGGVDDCSSNPLQLLADTTDVESEPMLALLTERRLNAGLPLDRGDDRGLGPLLNRLGFFGRAGLAAWAIGTAGWAIFGLGGIFGGIFNDWWCSPSSVFVAKASGEDDFSLVKVPCLPMADNGGW